MTIFGLIREKLRSPLARRLIVSIIVVSSTITLCLTALQLYGEYRSELGSIQAVFRQIEEVHLKSLSQSLWATDEAALQLQIEGIVRVPNLEYIAVREGDRIWAQAGHRASREIIERQYQMTYVHRGQTLEIGVLTVVASLDAVYGALVNRAVRILASNALKTFLVAGFAFAFFHWLVSRHLFSIAGYLRGLDLRGRASPLILVRAAGRRPDELDEVAAAINLMHENARSLLAKLHDSETRLRLSIQASSIGLWDWDLATNDMYFSPEWKSQLGYRDEEIPNRFEEWESRMHPEDLERTFAHVHAYLASPWRGYCTEFRLRHKDGSYRWIYIQADSIRDSSGKPVRMLGGNIDITERKRAEEKLRESENRYRDLVEHSQDLICTHDLDGRILSVNPWAAKVLGYEQAELVNVNLRDVLASGVRHELDGYLAAIRTDGAARGLMLVQPRAGGKRVWEYNNTLRTEGVSTPIVRGMAHDVTEQKRAERILAESEERYRYLFESNPMPMWIRRDDTLQIVAVNNAAVQLYGYTRDEFDRMTSFDLLSADYLAAFEKLLRERPAGISTYHHRGRHRKKDGSIIDVDVTSHPISHAGAPARLVLVQDITERKRAEQELERKTALAQLLESLARAANEAQTPGQAMRLCLERICEHGGWVLGRLGTYPPGESRSLPNESTWYEKQPGRFAEFKAASLDIRKLFPTWPFITTVVRENKPLWLEDIARAAGFGRQAVAGACGLRSAFAFPVSAQGEVVAFLEFYADEPRPADALLMEASTSVGSILARLIERSQATAERERLAKIVENSGAAIWSRAADDTLISWNAAAERLFGWTREEALGKRGNFLVPPERLHERQVIPERLARGEDSVVFETVRLRKDGTPIDVETRASVTRDASGNVIWTAFIVHDITERKRAEQALAESEEYYRQLFDSNPMPMWIADYEKRRFLEVNQAAINKYGYTRDEFLHMTTFDIRPPEEVAAYRAFIEQLTSTTEIARRRSRHRRKDGGIIDVETTAYPHHYAGRVARLVLINDVTERLMVEKALKDSEERFRAAFEQAAVGMALRGIQPRSSRWLRVNQKMCEIFGYTHEEFLQLTPIEVTASEDRDESIDYNERVARDEISSYTREKRYMRKNGELFWANLSVSVVREPDGNATHVIAAIQDITDKKRGIDAIHALAMRQSSIAELGIYAVTETDVQKVMDRALVLVRKALGASHVKVLRLLPDGKSLLLVSGTGWKDGLIGKATVPAESGSQAGYTLQQRRMADSGGLRYEPVIVEDFGAESRFRPPSLLKEHGILSGMSVAIYGAGVPFGVLGVHCAQPRSFTADDAKFLEATSSVLAAAIQRAESYEQIRQSREQLRALASRMVRVREEERVAIAREVHDELGQALTALKIDVALLIETVDLERRLPRLRIREDLTSLIGMIDQSIQSVRKISTQLRPVLLDELGFVAAFEWQSRDFESRHHIRCKMIVTEPILEPGSDAAIALFRIFQEALTNVVRHSGARDVIGELRQDGNDIVLRVHDNGKGMPALSRTSSHTLGLAGMRERAMMFGGDVQFESAEDQGTTVTARIPTTRAMQG